MFVIDSLSSAGTGWVSAAPALGQVTGIQCKGGKYFPSSALSFLMLVLLLTAAPQPHYLPQSQLNMD